jgi:hypothetical protein
MFTAEIAENAEILLERSFTKEHTKSTEFLKGFLCVLCVLCGKKIFSALSAVKLFSGV